MNLAEYIRALATLGVPMFSQAIVPYTWATKPLASSVDVGTMITITDVGGDGGSVWRATLDGWVPLGGVQVLALSQGTVAAPIATITGAASGIFVPIGGAGSLTIPAGMLLAGRAKLEIESFVRKSTATASADARVYMGPLGTASDPVIQNLTLTNADGQGARPYPSVGFIEGSMITTQAIGPGGQASTNSLTDRTVDLTVANKISFGIANGNVSDSYRLEGYSVKLILI